MVAGFCMCMLDMLGLGVCEVKLELCNPLEG